MEIYIKSYVEAHEDRLCALHSEVEALLNTCIGGQCRYAGATRDRLERFKADLESAILGDNRPDVSDHRLQWILRRPG